MKPTITKQLKIEINKQIAGATSAKGLKYKHPMEMDIYITDFMCKPSTIIQYN